MALDPITAGMDLANTIVSRIWPNKTQEEQQQLAAVLSMIQGQMAINQAEAQSSDPLQHWRGGLGWVCTLGYLWNYVLSGMVVTVSAALSHPIVVQKMDMSELSTLTIGMLGLGGMLVYQQVKSK